MASPLLANTPPILLLEYFFSCFFSFRKQIQNNSIFRANKELKTERKRCRLEVVGTDVLAATADSDILYQGFVFNLLMCKLELRGCF